MNDQGHAILRVLNQNIVITRKCSVAPIQSMLTVLDDANALSDGTLAQYTKLS